ncbi:uncharacterized membrane protein HdeD (DUF308 family) [Okibacterium sp. HSC-33S16]|uniref:HdeD family acid-resistance protein n=1 Tax=Okibacterium sp. HSC-33S16 TaxID=2910965 RepID=UPI0020A0832F|nr:DUF308 domain-containing protein [Okibacterium sp. HSC-33S16]MCP2032789.1 uncharacterized membrane protein HdeD (DUF308 family) [Okibacterium sp. HSC-33S16]
MKTVRLAIIVAGVVAILVGIAILVWPQATLALVAWLFGLYFIVSGVARIVKAAMSRGLANSYRAFLAVFGILLVVGGAFVLANPLFGVTVVATLIGFTWILEGIGVLVDVPRGRATWVTVLFGIVSIAAGVIVLVAPVAATVFWLQLTAVLLIVAGLMQAIQGAMIGRAPRSG